MSSRSPVSEFTSFTSYIYGYLQAEGYRRARNVEILKEEFASLSEKMPRKIRESAHFRCTSRLIQLIFDFIDRGDDLEAQLYCWSLSEMWRIKKEETLGTKRFYQSFKESKGKSKERANNEFWEARSCALRNFIWCKYQREGWLDDLKMIFEEIDGGEVKEYYRDKFEYWLERARLYEQQNDHTHMALSVSMLYGVVDLIRLERPGQQVFIAWLDFPQLKKYPLTEYREKTP